MFENRRLGIALAAVTALSAFVYVTTRTEEAAANNAPAAPDSTTPRLESPIRSSETAEAQQAAPAVTAVQPASSVVAKVAPPPVAPLAAPASAAAGEAEEEVLPAPTVFPASLDEVPSTPWRDAQLAHYTAQERGMLDFKLGLMSRMRECAGSVAWDGPVTVKLHYAFDPATHLATGTGVDTIEPTPGTESAVECIRTALVGSTMPMVEEPTGEEFHWATEVVFPLEKDRAYLFFSK
jgi:hypothetical protein